MRARSPRTLGRQPCRARSPPGEIKSRHRWRVDVFRAPGLHSTHNQNAGNIPLATWNTTSTCEITGWAGGTTAPGQPYANCRNHMEFPPQTRHRKFQWRWNTPHGNFTVAKWFPEFSVGPRCRRPEHRRKFFADRRFVARHKQRGSDHHGRRELLDDGRHLHSRQHQPKCAVTRNVAKDFTISEDDHRRRTVRWHRFPPSSTARRRRPTPVLRLPKRRLTSRCNKQRDPVHGRRRHHGRQWQHGPYLNAEKRFGITSMPGITATGGGLERQYPGGAAARSCQSRLANDPTTAPLPR